MTINQDFDLVGGYKYLDRILGVQIRRGEDAETYPYVQLGKGPAKSVLVVGDYDPTDHRQSHDELGFYVGAEHDDVLQWLTPEIKRSLSEHAQDLILSLHELLPLGKISDDDVAALEAIIEKVLETPARSTRSINTARQRAALAKKVGEDGKPVIANGPGGLSGHSDADLAAVGREASWLADDPLYRALRVRSGLDAPLDGHEPERLSPEGRALLRDLRDAGQNPEITPPR